MERLSKLRELVPVGFLKTYNITGQQIDEIINSDIIQQRNTIMMIASQRKYNKISYMEHIVKELSTYAVPRDPFEVFSPLQVQTFSYLLEFLWDQREEIVKKIKLISTQANFQYISLVCFPIIFGYFSNEYLCERAADFYIKACEYIALPEIIKLVKIFFSLDHVYSFSDQLFRETIWRFYPNFPDIEFIADKILLHSIKLLRLLPEAHLRFLRHFYTEGNQQNLWQVIISVLLCPQIHLQFYSSPLSILKLSTFNIDELVEVLLQKGEKEILIPIKLENMQNSLNNTAPFYIKDGAGAALRSVLTVFDVHELMTLPLMFPAHMHCVSDVNAKIQVDPHFAFVSRFFIDYNLEDHLPPLFFDYFIPKKPADELTKIWNLIRNEIPDPIDFLLNDRKILGKFSNLHANTELINTALEIETERLEFQGSNFERILEMMQLRNLIYGWKIRGAHYLRFFSRGLAFADQNIPRNLQEAIDGVAVGESRFWRVIQYFSSAELFAFSNINIDISKMESRFKNLIERERTSGVEIPQLAAHNLISKISFLVTSVDPRSSFLQRVVVLNFVLDAIQQLTNCIKSTDITERKNLFTVFIISIFDITWILKTSIYLHSTLFNGPISWVVPDEFHQNWGQFIPSLLSMLTKDKELLSKFLLLSTTPMIVI